MKCPNCQYRIPTDILAAELGRRGGLAKSRKKTLAVRKNARKARAQKS
jgi:hypothetical protein